MITTLSFAPQTDNQDIDLVDTLDKNLLGGSFVPIPNQNYMVNQTQQSDYRGSYGGVRPVQHLRNDVQHRGNNDVQDVLNIAQNHVQNIVQNQNHQMQNLVQRQNLHDQNLVQRQNHHDQNQFVQNHHDQNQFVQNHHDQNQFVQNHHGQNHHGPNKFPQFKRRDMFDVPVGFPFHPAELFYRAGQGFQNILDNKCMIRVIYFVELVSNNNYYNKPNLAAERKFIIVYSIKSEIEHFVAVEITLTHSKTVHVTRCLYEPDLSIIKSSLKINYFNPQIYNHYKNLKQLILKNQKFQNIVSAYGWRNNHMKNWSHLRINNINEIVHPVKILQIGFNKVNNIGKQIRRIMVLNISSHQNIFVYLFRIDTVKREKFYLGMKLLKTHQGMELVSLLLDKERRVCENLFKIKILTREFSNYYKQITGQFQQLAGASFNQFNGYQNGNVAQVNQINSGGFNNGGFLLGSAAPGEVEGDMKDEMDNFEDLEDELSDEEFGDISDEEFA